jgi:ribosomal protein S18 acetylase RimI-like enzyme
VPVTAEGEDPEQVARVLALAWGRDPDDPQVQTNVRKLRAELAQIDGAERQVYKAVRAGRVVGFARIRRDPGDVSVWWFAGVCVDPAHQRRGVGTALFTHCVRYAAERGSQLIRSEAHADNTASLAFHRALGCQDEGAFVAEDGDSKRAFSYRVAGPALEDKET